MIQTDQNELFHHRLNWWHFDSQNDLKYVCITCDNACVSAEAAHWKTPDSLPKAEKKQQKTWKEATNPSNLREEEEAADPREGQRFRGSCHDPHSWDDRLEAKHVPAAAEHGSAFMKILIEPRKKTSILTTCSNSWMQVEEPGAGALPEVLLYIWEALPNVFNEHKKPFKERAGTSCCTAHLPDRGHQSRDTFVCVQLHLRRIPCVQMVFTCWLMKTSVTFDAFYFRVGPERAPAPRGKSPSVTGDFRGATEKNLRSFIYSSTQVGVLE